MSQYSNYHKGLLYLVHLIITADRVIDADELRALETIQKLENMPDDIYDEFMDEVNDLNEREIYERGIDTISLATLTEQKKAFAWLLKISEADGHIHAKEIRFLLYSIKKTGIEFNDVVEEAKNLPSLA